MRYVLSKPARVSIRAGLQDGGSLLATIRDWVARPAGVNVERWDGHVAGGALDVSRHPKLQVGGSAFALPTNAIVVLPKTSQVRLIADLPTGVT